MTASQLQSRLNFHQILFRPIVAYLIQNAYQREAIGTRKTDSVRRTTAQMISCVVDEFQQLSSALRAAKNKACNNNTQHNCQSMALGDRGKVLDIARNAMRRLRVNIIWQGVIHCVSGKWVQKKNNGKNCGPKS